MDRLDILFDDMRGDFPGLAKTQAEILRRIREQSKANSISMCPTYYSDDPVLDRIFGQRPAEYLGELGSRLEQGIGVFWTGERICSESYSPTHLREVAKKLGRKVSLWDNYPVNDTPRMCKFLHLRAFQGRPAEIAAELTEHGINPMNQPNLTRIPAETLIMSYAQGTSYSPVHAFQETTNELCGEELAHEIRTDLAVFQDQGLDAIGADQKNHLIGKYEKFENPVAREIVRWLIGEYLVTEQQIRETHGEIGA